MINSPNRYFYIAILATGWALLPKFAFSQQEEPRTSSQFNYSSSPQVKTNALTMPSEPKLRRLKKNVPPLTDSAVIAQSPRTDAPLEKGNVVAVIKHKDLETASSSALTFAAAADELNGSANEELSTKREDKIGSQDLGQVKYSAKVNSSSYLWIGSFLVLAGLVLGLLFGKPAILVSLAGVVFIALGFFI